MATAKHTTRTQSLSALVKEDEDLMKMLVKETVQAFLEAEMDSCIGAGPSERTDARRGYRAGYYTRNLITRIGSIELRVPRDRDGLFSTELFDRYQRSEKAFVLALAEIVHPGCFHTVTAQDLAGSQQPPSNSKANPAMRFWPFFCMVDM